MNCMSHADAAAAALCTRCDQPICTSCITEHGGRQFCPGCAAFVAERSARRPPPAQGLMPDVGAAASVAAGGPTYGGPPPGQAPPQMYADAQGAAPSLVPAGQVYGDAQGPQPGLAPAGQMYGDDLRAGVAPGGQTYAGQTADEVYQGPAPGQVYAAPQSGGSPYRLPSGAGGGAQEEGSLGRAVLFGAGAGLLGAFLWYGIAILTDWKIGLVAIAIGWLVGFATAAGAGRQGTDVGLLAVAIALFSMLAGEYLMWSHFIQDVVAEESEYEQMVLEMGSDGRFSRDELARFYDWGVDGEDGEAHFEDLDRSEVADLRDWLQQEYEDYSSAAAESAPGSGGLSLSQFVTLSFFDLWNLVFFGIGCAGAFKIAIGADSD